MKIKYLGTAAAEGIPAIFCHCEICKHAREHGGKNIRTRAQALIDDKIMLDLGPDTYLHLLAYKLDITELEHCFITHVHDDHFVPGQVLYRQKGYGYVKPGTRPLTIYGSEDVGRAMNVSQESAVTKDGSVLYKEVRPYEMIEVEEYKITALPAYHGTDHPYIYIIEKDGKRLLYAHDTDVFFEEVWRYLEEKHIRFDLVSLDCTEGVKSMDYHCHMNFERDMTVKERMIKSGLVYPYTIFVANHFSHNGQTTYDRACEMAKECQMLVTYDGMEIEF